MIFLRTCDICIHGLQHGRIVQGGINHLSRHKLVTHIGYEILSGERPSAIVAYAKGGGYILALNAL